MTCLIILHIYNGEMLIGSHSLTTHLWLWLFYRCSLDLSFFFATYLQGGLADHHQTLPHGGWWPRFKTFGKNFGCPPNFGGPKTSNFGEILRLDGKYLQNATRHSQSEKGIANYGHSHTGKLNSVYLVHKWRKNRTGVLTNPTGSPILSCFKCKVTSHVDKVYTYRPNTYTKFIVIKCVLSSSKYTKSSFGWGFAPDPTGGAYDAPQIP